MEKKKKQEAKEEQKKTGKCVIIYLIRLLILLPFNKVSNCHFIDLSPELGAITGDSMWGDK